MKKEFDTVVLDVDGTLTDGRIIYSSSGEELKAFDVKDGLIIRVLVELGYRVVVITGRKSDIVQRRMNEIGVSEVIQGVGMDKVTAYEALVRNKRLDEAKICFIGDDLNDLSIIKRVGISACPADACLDFRENVQYISSKKGGEGAVRDILEYYLRLNSKWKAVIEYVNQQSQ